MPAKVLFTGGGGSASESIYRQWSDRYDLFFADANPAAFPPAIPKARRITIPLAREASFTSSVLEACQTHHVDVIVPGVDEELLALSTMHDVQGWPKILLPNPEFVKCMLDKSTTNKKLIEHGLDAPLTLPPQDADQVGYPLIIKPRSGRGSRGVMKVERPEQIDGYLKLYGGSPDDYVVQELGIGDEYTVFVAADEAGRLKAIIPVIAFEKRGVTVRAETRVVKPIIDYVTKFQDAVKATGVYNVQCMLTRDGRVLPFEVNPRISTTFVLAIATGFDPIEMILRADNIDGVFTPEGVWQLHRSWHNEISKIG